MLFEESRFVRSFLGRVEPGDDVVEALTLLCDANDLSSATVRVTGTLRDVEVVRFVGGEYVPVVDDAGPFEIVHGDGQMAKLGDQSVLRLNVLVAITGPAGQQLVFGQLRRAVAQDCEFVVEAREDLQIERRLDPATGRFPMTAVTSLQVATPAVATRPVAAPAPARERRAPATIAEPAGTSAEPKPKPEAGVEKSDLSWADAMEASEDIKPASRRDRSKRPSERSKKTAADIYAGLDDDDGDPSLRAGDLLDHPKLGECRVIKVEEDSYAHIRLSRGQIRKLALEVIELKFDGERDGKNVFKVRVRK